MLEKVQSALTMQMNANCPASIIRPAAYFQRVSLLSRAANGAEILVYCIHYSPADIT